MQALISATWLVGGNPSRLNGSLTFLKYNTKRVKTFLGKYVLSYIQGMIVAEPYTYPSLSMRIAIKRTSSINVCNNIVVRIKYKS
jgi:hypothetical protein